MKDLLQVVILVMGALSIYLISRNDRHSWKGFFLALLSQPVWMFSSYMAGQWGLMILSCWYTYYNFKGLVNFRS